MNAPVKGQSTKRPRNPFASLSRDESRRLGAMFAVIFFLLFGGLILMGIATSSHYRLADGTLFGWGTGFLALTLGMRHAFDADHISAIDNTTRKLMAEGQRPMGVGFFFSLGHSSVVTALAIILNFGIKSLGGQVKDPHSALHHYTGLIGTSISGAFLVLIALLNLVVLISVVRVFKAMRKGLYDEAELEKHLDSRGFTTTFKWGAAFLFSCAIVSALMVNVGKDSLVEHE
jgi:high-affinity nickel-transport protein